MIVLLVATPHRSPSERVQLDQMQPVTAAGACFRQPGYETDSHTGLSPVSGRAEAMMGLFPGYFQSFHKESARATVIKLLLHDIGIVMHGTYDYWLVALFACRGHACLLYRA